MNSSLEGRGGISGRDHVTYSFWSSTLGLSAFCWKSTINSSDRVLLPLNFFLLHNLTFSITSLSSRWFAFETSSSNHLTQFALSDFAVLITQQPWRPSPQSPPSSCRFFASTCTLLRTSRFTSNLQSPSINTPTALARVILSSSFPSMLLTSRDVPFFRDSLLHCR